jgi:hypothetical protein
MNYNLSKARGNLKAEREGKYMQMVRSIKTSEAKTATRKANTPTVWPKHLFTHATLVSKAAQDVSWLNP